jgi:methylmalonyl-CoA mutase
MTLQDQALAGGFPQPNDEIWRKAVDRALKGGSFEKLISKSYGGTEIAPLYSRLQELAPRALRTTPGRWAVLARADFSDPDQANRFALQDLEGGADGLHLVFAGSQGAYGAGLADDSDEAIAHIFKDIRLDYGIPTIVEYSPRAPNAAAAIMRLVDKLHIEPSITRLSFGFDPLGAQALHGFLPAPWAAHAKVFAQRAKSAAAAGFRRGAVAADARVVHGAGGTEAQELGFALAGALAYLRALDGAGLALDDARDLLCFRLAADADELAGVAKFRALRRLWALVEESCGLPTKPALVQAETAWRMMSRRDPWNNILRATLAVFSAAVGGADTITVLPFTQPLGAPDAFARRLARDTQLVLQDESHVHEVDDPVNGAGGFEALTDDLSARGWAVFQRIESLGGLPAALETGAFQSMVAETAAQRAKNVARAKEKVTGANEFPNIGETPLDVVGTYDPARDSAEAPAGALISKALRIGRLSEPFETLRDRSDERLAASGARPRVFLANLGPVAAFTARANFAKNFFEAAGIEAVFGPETDDANEIVAACRASGAKLACLCSSDVVYSDAAEAVARALKGAGAKVYLAGRPGDLEESLRNSGVSEFIYVGCDMYDVLHRAFEAAAG